MHTITVTNVNVALPIGVGHLRSQGIRRPSRNGPVLESPYPVCTIYKHPDDNVLICPVRRANPYFHLYEALWIIAGRNDVASLAQFNARMGEYSDDGETFNGAYGARLRARWGVDQLASAKEQLAKDADTRRVVCSMWDPATDMGGKSKDLPCNTQLYFLVRDKRLSLTVTCRSNDIIWGAYGANAVQFSFLLQYMAGMSGYEYGPLYQISNSFHAYTEMPGNPWGALVDHYKINGACIDPFNLYDGVPIDRVELINDKVLFDSELDIFVDQPFNSTIGYSNKFFADVAVPMMLAWRARKLYDGDTERHHISNIHDTRWRKACEMWRITSDKAVAEQRA